jgi:hypothetical protein
MSGMRGSLGVHALALAACIGLDVPVLAQDNSGLVAGKDAWARASCFDCHGSMAQGGSGGDYPVGPSLRNITFRQRDDGGDRELRDSGDAYASLAEGRLHQG